MFISQFLVDVKIFPIPLYTAVPCCPLYLLRRGLSFCLPLSREQETRWTGVSPFQIWICISNARGSLCLLSIAWDAPFLDSFLINYIGRRNLFTGSLSTSALPCTLQNWLAFFGTKCFWPDQYIQSTRMGIGNPILSDYFHYFYFLSLLFYSSYSLVLFFFNSFFYVSDFVSRSPPFDHLPVMQRRCFFYRVCFYKLSCGESVEEIGIGATQEVIHQTCTVVLIRI